jgi:hypothetical protein
MNHRARVFDLCGDDELGYERSRTQFDPGVGFNLDETYRLAHLPLITPDHPGVIPAREGTFYEMGLHPRVFSLVLPIPSGALLRSKAYLELESELSASPFGLKIAWSLLKRRQAKLHATICGSLSVGGSPDL